MTRRRHLALAVAVAFPAAFAAVAATARPAAAERDRHAEAKQLFRAGQQMFDKGVYEDAAALLEQAYAILPLPAIAFSAAQAYRLQYFADDDPRKLKRAIELYQAYVGATPRGGRWADAAQSLAELKPRLDRIELEKRGPVAAIPTRTAASSLTVTTQVDGARVVVDGGPSVTAPYSAEVSPGKHRIVVTAKGYYTFDEQRDVFEGQPRVVEVELRARPALVTVAAPRGAQIAVDGRPFAVAPLRRPLELPAGKHLVAVTDRGHRPWSREISVVRGQTVALDAELATTGQRKVAYGVFVASGASFVAAGVVGAFALASGGEAKDLDQQRRDRGLTREELVEYDGLVADYESRRGASFVLLGVGGGLAITGALLYLLDRPAAETAEAAPPSTVLGVRPVGGGDFAGLAVNGAF